MDYSATTSSDETPAERSPDVPERTEAVSAAGEAGPAASRPLEADLSAAVERVAARWGVDQAPAADVRELREHLEAVARAVDAGAAPEERGMMPSQLAVRRRLLDLLRRELVQGWEDPADPPDVRLVLDRLRSLEAVRAALNPSKSDDFVSSLMRPDALDLVVEVAHDLRSPLTSILFLADPLRRGQSGEVNEVQRRQLGIIYSAALGLLTVASDMIELAQGGDRLTDHAPVPFSILETLQSVRDIVQPVAEEKDLTLRFLPVEPDHRLGYSVALNRVLLNLTTNALKFTEEGFVEIVARAVDPDRPARIEFSVRDTGDGIDPEILADLYQPFRRNRASSRYGFSGTGLGLAISKKLVEVMGSELKLETSKGWGTRFYFELNLPPCTPTYTDMPSPRDRSRNTR